jgi:hypothetical protein
MYEGVSRFSMTQTAQVGGMEQYQALMVKMSDPKLTDAQREQVINQLEKASEQMQASMQKMADPAYIKSMEEQKKNFGCERMELRTQAGKLTGELRCSQTVGARIPLTGSMKFLGR